MNTQRRLWREPMLWLVAGIPLATLVAGFLTLRIAGGSGALDAAPETVRRTAQTQTTDLSADEQAARLGLDAELEFLAEGRVVLRSPSIVRSANAEGSLALQFVHPTDAAGDIDITLERDGHDWRGRAMVDGQTAWGLRLDDAGGHWRLVAKLTPGQRRIRLEPALASP